METDFVPDLDSIKIYDEIISFPTLEAFKFTNPLTKEEGIFVGIYSGVALPIGVHHIESTYKKEIILLILPDTGERYFSTKLWI